MNESESGPSSNPALGTHRRQSQGTPEAPALHARPRTTPVSLSVGLLIMMACGIALMFGSVGSWIHVTGAVGTLSFHGSLNGTDAGVATLIGVNGYVTFIAGVVLLVFAGLALTNDDLALAMLTAIVAVVTVVFAVYDMFRIVQKISQATPPPGTAVSVGAGLICVLSAAVVAVLIAVLRLFSR